MIQPINCINNKIYKQNPSFKNAESNAKTVLEPTPALKDDSSALLKYMEKKEQQDMIDKRNSYFLSSIIIAASVGSFLFLPKIIKKSVSQTTSGISSAVFSSLKNDKKIPTLDTCKSINPKLRTFLENQVMYAKATAEELTKTGSPEAANRILMYGEPGSGKSFFAKIFAKTLGADYMEIKYSDLNKRYCGEHIENMKGIFSDIMQTANSNPNKKYVVNFNEIDALAVPIEQLNGSASHSVFKKEERTTFLIFLEEAAEKAPNVVIIGSSNASPAKGLDGAVVSRFQNVINVPYPDENALYEAFIAHLSNLADGKTFIENNKEQIQQIAKDMYTRNASFRNLNQIINESKNLYLRNVMKDKNSSFKIEYIKEALKALDITDGEVTRVKNKAS